MINAFYMRHWINRHCLFADVVINDIYYDIGRHVMFKGILELVRMRPIKIHI